MEPRLTSSTQWSTFPPEITDLLKNLIQEQFGGRLPPGEFIVEGRIFPEEVQLRIGHVAKEDIGQNNFEGSLEYKSGEEKVLDIIQSLYEATLAMMDSFVKDEKVDLPIVWKKYEFDTKDVYLQHSKVNSQLEAEANKLLGVSQQTALIHKDDELQIEELKVALGLNQEGLKSEEFKQGGSPEAKTETFH